MSDLKINKILIIDKSERFRQVLSRFFSKYFPHACVTEYDPEFGCPGNTFPWHNYDLMILNFRLGVKSNGLDWLRICKTGDKFPATILITDHGHEQIAVGAFRYGAQDYLSKKGLTASKLKNSVHRTINKHRGEKNRDDGQLTQRRLVNRVKFYQMLNDVDGDGVLLLVSIDNFSDIHNSIGLILADDLTSHLANLIIDSSSSIKNSHVEVIRISDDSIAIITLGIEDKKIYTDYADSLCKQVDASPFEHEGKPLNFNISIGITFIKENARGAKNNIACADAAVRLAMDSPDNSFVVFGSKTESTSILDPKLVLHIQNSIKENRVQPFFQPIISVSEATEILDTTIYQLRTKIIDLNGQLLGYSDFFPVLKQNNLIRGLDYWVIRHVLDRLYKIKKEGLKDKLGFLVTLEEDTLLSSGLIKWIDKLIKYFELPSLASSVMFEIRYEHFIAHQENVVKTMMTLRDNHGISFTLSNVRDLSILKTCSNKTSFEFVKIPIYETIDSKEESIDINELRQLLKTSTELGSLTIVDRIDNADYLSSAIECGADFVSGYLVHPPEEEITTEDEITM